MQRLFALYRSDELRFEDLEQLVGDDEHSVLFRLKGRCHALFRREHERRAVAMRREALFDLAVGSLFHEAMKFRENFYQREVYGPRVRALRTESGARERGALPGIREDPRRRRAAPRRRSAGERGAADPDPRAARAAARRIPRQRLRDALPDREPGRRGGRLRGRVCAALLALIHGDAATGHLRRGPLVSRERLLRARPRRPSRARAPAAGDHAEVDRLSAYARGMTAYLAGDYAASVACLSQWLEAAPSEDAGARRSGAARSSPRSRCSRRAKTAPASSRDAGASAGQDRAPARRGGAQRRRAGLRRAGATAGAPRRGSTASPTRRPRSGRARSTAAR